MKITKIENKGLQMSATYKIGKWKIWREWHNDYSFQKARKMWKCFNGVRSDWSGTFAEAEAFCKNNIV